MPPRMWRSSLLFSKTSFTCACNAEFKYRSRSVTSLCTVDLDTPNAFAVCRTVACRSKIYCASAIALAEM